MMFIFIFIFRDDEKLLLVIGMFVVLIVGGKLSITFRGKDRRALPRISDG